MQEKRESNCDNSFCISLNEHTRNCFCETKQKVRFRDKQEFFLGRKKIFLITKGYVIVFRSRANGKRKGTEFLHKGDLLGITSLYNSLGNLNDICVYAKADGEACVFSTQKFADYCLIYPDATLAVLKNSVHRFGVLIRLLDSLCLDNSEDRVLNLLNLLFEEDMPNPSHRNLQNLPFSHEELALLAGLNRVTTTRAIDNLQKQGLFIAGRGHIKRLPVRDNGNLS